ncbi:hypothetical protein C8R45DRAFT_828674 [Mycena sanguinolenta]|nr:hypothetical protein C8R45DRAFT_828674 [Mycena sanguinolenta]
MDFPIGPSLNTIQIIRNGVYSVYCLALHEWLEMYAIYLSRWNSIKVAYLLCRYYHLLLWPLVIYAYGGNHTAQTCSKLTQIVTSLFLPMVRDLFPDYICLTERSNCLPQQIYTAVMLMRAHAFAGRNIRVLVLLLVFYAALTGINIWFFCFNVDVMADFVFELFNGTGCFPDYATNKGGEHLVLSQGASLIMDLVSLSIIIIYCLRTRSTRGSLGRLFISQGVSSNSSIVFVSAPSPLCWRPQGYHNGIGLLYILVISNLMACRIILDLRRKALPTETEILRQHSFLVDQALESSDLWVIEEDPTRYPDNDRG